MKEHPSTREATFSEIIESLRDLAECLLGDEYDTVVWIIDGLETLRDQPVAKEGNDADKN